MSPVRRESHVCDRGRRLRRGNGSRVPHGSVGGRVSEKPSFRRGRMCSCAVERCVSWNTSHSGRPPVVIVSSTLIVPAMTCAVFEVGHVGLEVLESQCDCVWVCVMKMITRRRLHDGHPSETMY
jgi:hypothetical protein